MHVDRIKNRNGVVTTLVRECYRDDGKVKKRTVPNISHLPPEIQLSMELQLRGEVLVPSSGFETESARGHGHVDAVVGTRTQTSCL